MELSYTLSSSEAFPWSDVADSMRPDDLADEAWAPALKTLKVRFGDTWDSYLTRFRDDVDRGAKLGRTEFRIDRLLRYELSQALLEDALMPTLASVQDAGRSARGLALSFTRTYQNTLRARHTKGKMGYGWTDSLSTYAAMPEEDRIVVHFPGGSEMTFACAGGNWIAVDPLETTKLLYRDGTYVLRFTDGSMQVFDKTTLKTLYLADPSGNKITYVWADEKLAKITHTDGQSLFFAYEGDRLASVVDDCGRRVSYAYTGDLLTSVTSCDGLVTRYEYHANDGTPCARALTRIVRPDATTREFEYDADGWLVAVSSDSGREKTTIVRSDGQAVLTNADGGHTKIKTGLLGEVLESQDALGGISRNTYTTNDWLKSTQSPSGLSAGMEYDANGYVSQTTSPTGSKTSFAYRSDFGNLTSVTDAKGHTMQYSYDAFGRQTATVFPDNSRLRSEITSAGDVSATYNRRGEKISYSYDAQGRVTKKVWANGRTFTYAYDAKGNVIRATDSVTGTVTLEYDAYERPTKITYPGNRGFTFQYDAVGRMVERALFDGQDGVSSSARECFEYDASGRLVRVTDGTSAYLANSYDGTTGRLVRQTNGNGTTTDYGYDKAGRVTSIEHCNAEGRIVESLRYCYDVDGRCIRSASLSGEDLFAYDDDGQLTVAYYSETEEKETFSYDAVGNRTNANGATYTINDLNQYTALAVDATPSSRRAVLTYDLDGNLTSVTDTNNTTTTYAYDTLNRLVAVTNVAKNIRWSCEYDVFGNRVSVTDNGVTTERVYLQGTLPSVAAEYRNGACVSRHILAGAVRIADLEGEAASSSTGGDSIRYYHADLIGSVRLTTGADGKTQSRTSYKAFGDVRVATGGATNGYGHASRVTAAYVGTLGVETDPTGLLFMRNRYYSPTLGRFIQPDPIGLGGGDVNWYRYCGNDAILNVDASGLSLRSNFCKYHWSNNLRYLANRPKTMIEAIALHGERQSAFSSQYHCKGRYKYVYPGGHDEDVYDANGNLETSPECMGTYNFGTGIGHFPDMEMYWICGNTEDDTTPFHKRIFNLDVLVHNLIRDIEEFYPVEFMIVKDILLDDNSGGGDSGGGAGGGSIMNESDWLDISTNKNASTATYSLRADVTLTKTKCRVYSFGGTFNGNGHKITLSGELSDGDLFKSFSDDGATFNNAVFGNQHLASKYTNCKFNDCKASYAGSGRGAFADVAIDCTFKNCSALANISISKNTYGYGIGAFVGSATSCTFENCSASGSVVGDDHIGGFMGKAFACTVSQCRSSCSVRGQSILGGFVGQAGDSIKTTPCRFENCRATGSVSGGGWAGGFVGMAQYANLVNCSATGSVVEDDSIADTSSTYTCFCGGFAGSVSCASVGASSIQNCTASGAVSARNFDAVGGFAGRVDGLSKVLATVNCCSSAGSVVGRDPVGGFIGRVDDCVLNDCMAVGSATAYGDKNGLSVAVSAFLGSGSSVETRRCYASGKVVVAGSTILTYSGGLGPSGKVICTSSDCYWNIDTTGQKTSAFGTGLTKGKAQTEKTFSGWDFTSVWQLVDGVPTLRGGGASDASGDGDSSEPTTDPLSKIDLVGDGEGCFVSGEGTYAAGETVTMQASAASDKLFDGWYSDAACTNLLSTSAAYSFVVGDASQRVYAKFVSKESVLDETRLYAYDRYVARRGEWCLFYLAGYVTRSTTLSVSGLPAGLQYFGDYLAIAGVPERTQETTLKVTLANEAGTKVAEIPFVVVAPEDEADDETVVEFSEEELSVSEGETLRIGIWGGGLDVPCRAKLYLASLSADLKDLDLTKVTVDGATLKKVSFPLTLEWAAGDAYEKIVEIPIKTDAAVEADETLVFQLAAVQGQELGEASVCRVTIHDTGYDALKAKIEAGTATKAEQSTWKKLAANLDVPYVTGLASPADGGKVAGSGYCAAGKKVTLKATANKGYVFVGWYPVEGFVSMGPEEDGSISSDAIETIASTCLSRLSSLVLAEMPTNDVAYTAYFITSEEDKSNIVATVNGMAFETGRAEVAPYLATNIWTGVYLEWPVAASALSATTVKVTGLPTGLKFSAKPVTTKVTTGSGKSKVTTVVTNVPANTIYGTPTAASKTKKVEGDGEQWMAIPSRVKITVTTAGKSTADYVIDLVVDEIPAFAVGSFDGWYERREEPCGSVTMTLAANGKLSGKVLTPVEGKGKSYSFAATSLKGILTDEDGTVTNVSVSATLTGEKKVAVPLDLAFTMDSIGIGCADGVFSSPWTGSLRMGQNGWKRGGYVFPYFKKDIATTLDNGLTLTFKKGGSVKVAGKILGDDGAKLVSASGSAQLVPDPSSPDAMFLTVYIAPAKNLTNGFCQIYSVTLTGPEDSNEVAGVEVRESE